MGLIHAHGFSFAFAIPISAAGAKRRAMVKWLMDRLPAETIGVAYEPRLQRVRVEMLVRVGWSVEQLQRYATAVELLALAYADTFDEAQGLANLEAGRASLRDALREAALPEPH